MSESWLAGLKGFETIKAVHLEAQPFTVEQGILTPTLKIKRHAARDAFKTQIAQLYAETFAAVAASTKLFSALEKRTQDSPTPCFLSSSITHIPTTFTPSHTFTSKVHTQKDFSGQLEMHHSNTWTGNTNIPFGFRPTGTVYESQSAPSYAQHPIDPFYGPLLRYGDVDLVSAVWRGSVLVVTTSQPREMAPQLVLHDGETQDIVQGQAIDSYRNNIFWRFDISVSIGQQPKRVTYSFHGLPTQESWTFHVASMHETWRWTFTSCNGYSEGVDVEKEGGHDILWSDFLRKHEAEPFHVMVGGGDQLYCDPLWKLPQLQPWLAIEDKNARQIAPFTEEARAVVEDFYFHHYVKCFFYTSKFRQAAAIVPYAFIIDDHDLFDGAGSYPIRLQNSYVFQGIIDIGFRFFLLFQSHTTHELSRHHGYFGDRGYTWLKHFGPHQVVLGVDTRRERTLEQVVSPRSMAQIFDTLNNRVSPHAKHLVVVFGIPMVYPRMGFAETAFNFLKSTGLTKLNVFKTGAFSKALNVFGQPELLDDLNDHWTADGHLNERKSIILAFQEFAKRRAIRVTLIAGDVHAAACGRFVSKGITSPQQLLTDHRYMVQVVSSAIVNVAPPAAVIQTLHASATTYSLDSNTEESMIDLFVNDVDGTELSNRKVLGRRNYATASFDQRSGELTFNINVEKVERDGSVPYRIIVPPLLRKN
ncbi:hypothetical protein GQ42DRAFT_177137 [Ramicandelaber brevisporus]|nr:hypothetical protein GQ42DRAFT_177137 [Ramicandelaber brevisporus]